MAVCSAAADAMMSAVLAESETNGTDDDFIINEDTMKCQLNAAGLPEAKITEKAPLSAEWKEKLKKLFKSFTTMIVNMFANLRDILPPGANMTFHGQFYGAIVFNQKLENIPGLFIDASLAAVQFPIVADPMDLFTGIPPVCM